MPELPEVETVRRGLDPIIGRRIAAVDVLHPRTVRRTSPEALAAGLVGASIVGTSRRGKYLLVQLDSGEQLMIHLRMSGRVLLAERERERPGHTHVVVHLEPSDDPAAAAVDELWFVDPRTFGEMVVFDPELPGALPELGRLGIDPVTDGLDRAQLAAIVRRRNRQLKALLLDQHILAGIGNIYADEILHRARLAPTRLSSTLTARQITALHGAIHSVLSEAIAAGGSTLEDTQYVGVAGDGGLFQLDHRVYGRAGQRCLTCRRATIASATVAGRTTCWCPRCQR